MKYLFLYLPDLIEVKKLFYYLIKGTHMVHVLALFLDLISL